MASGACSIKLFMVVIYRFSEYAGVYIPIKPLQPKLMFVGEARSLP